MDQFERIRKIGKGNFGDVLLVQRKNDQKLFAIKRVDLSFREGFAVDPLNEVKVLKSLDHPNIIQHYDSFIHNNKLCILMEYADNADLSLKIKVAREQGHFDEITVLYSINSLLQILNWFAQLSVAILYLHSQKILHRDIKVQNIFLTNDGLIKLGDFGIARTLDNTSELAQTSIGIQKKIQKTSKFQIGTPFYLSPEICQNHQYNHKIDIWMLGCTLYELCCLEKPFVGESINAIAHKIINDQQAKIPQYYSEALSEIIDQMLEKNPDRRPEISTIIQLPIIQAELIKLNNLYQLKFNYQLPITFPPIKKIRQHQNSIHFLVEKAKQQQGQSPLGSRRSNCKPNHTESEQNSPNFKQLQTSARKQSLNNYEKQRPGKNLHTLPECNDEQIFPINPQSERTFSNDNKQLKYQRVISINTQIDDSNKRNQEVENQPTLQKNVKTFNFADQFFNPNTPTSPNRTILLTDFLKRKIGNEKFAQMKILLESSNDPMKVLEQKMLMQEVLGDQHMDCIKMFKLLISSSVTPQASHFRTKSAQVFEKQDTLMDLIKDVQFLPQSSIGQNPGFEISFKDLQSYQQ